MTSEATMIRLDNLDFGRFVSLKGEPFRVTANGASGFVDLTLKEVAELGSPYPGSARAPFSLIFQGNPGIRLPQRMYRFAHATLGIMEILITQLSDTREESTFEAVFT